MWAVLNKKEQFEIMSKSFGQKQKLLQIAKILMEESDEKHVLSTQNIITYLSALDIHAERKSIYNDMNVLIDYGYDIIQIKKPGECGYYIGSREFELAELKLLVDAVQSSRFISAKKSRELIKKIEALGSKHDAAKLHREVYVVGRVKTENESVYYNIDTVYRAMEENKKIEFMYLDWNVQKKLMPRKDGVIYRVSPWGLIWRDENYYLMAYDESSDSIKHYRVDKMGKVTILKQERMGAKVYKKIDMAIYSNQTFGMFGGEEETIVLSFPQSLIGVAIDRFGQEIDIYPDTTLYGKTNTALHTNLRLSTNEKKENDKIENDKIEEDKKENDKKENDKIEDGKMDNTRFKIRSKIMISSQFFGWLSGIGKEVQIVSPEHVKEQYKEWLMSLYKNS